MFHDGLGTFNTSSVVTIVPRFPYIMMLRKRFVYMDTKSCPTPWDNVSFAANGVGIWI